MRNLALKYRPKTLNEIVGQNKLTTLIDNMIKNSYMPHSFFYGPPGCGKTTICKVISKTLDRPLYELNATTLKVNEIREIIKSHTNTLQKPIIFIDEVHRLSKSQQEVLLPFMEDSLATFLGASTQNPFYSLTSSIRSRSHMFELSKINNGDLKQHLEEVLEKESIEVNSGTKEYLVSSSNGDMRAMLNLLESSSSIENPLRLETLKQIRQQNMTEGSSEESSHYELISQLIKNIRGSNIDASLKYLAKLIYGNEPAEYIARRLAIFASEDIGNANPNALNLASSTLNIVKHIGYPEAKISLSQLVVYLVSSPKSRSSYEAINMALKDISNDNIGKYYNPTGIGFEKTLNEWHLKIQG